MTSTQIILSLIAFALFILGYWIWAMSADDLDHEVLAIDDELEINDLEKELEE